MQDAPREHSAILSTFIKLPFVVKTFVLSIFEWPLNRENVKKKSSCQNTVFCCTLSGSPLFARVPVYGFPARGSNMLEKYLNIEGLLEESLKIKSALEST